MISTYVSECYTNNRGIRAFSCFNFFNQFRLISGGWFRIWCQFCSVTSQFCATTYPWFYEIVYLRVK